MVSKITSVDFTRDALLSNQETSYSDRRNRITVLSWNCLADCYAQGSFASRIKDPVILRWSSRSKRIFDVLRQAKADVVCLQEVDHYDGSYKPFLSSMNYTAVYVQRRGRDDGILIAIRKDKLEILETDIVQFDDLAYVPKQSFSDTHRSRFRKQNVALILLVRTKYSETTEDGYRDRCFTICTTHMYWNPTLPHVKLAQARYLLERITFIRQENGLPPTASILTGDFNSLPGSNTYRCIQDGISFPMLSGYCKVGAADRAFSSVASRFSRRNAVRFICDGNLGRLARWLRLLGVDTALEEIASQSKRTEQNDFSSLFAVARTERRVIVTTSTGLYKRASCPETFLVKPSKSGKLEDCLVALLNCYEVQLDKSNFLSICGKCGGAIEKCSSGDMRLAGKEFPTDRQLFVCVRCLQVYWKSASANGSSARALRLAEDLFSTVQGSRRRTRGRKSGTNRKCSSEIRNSCWKDCNCSGENVEGISEGEDAEPRREIDFGTTRHHWLKYTSALSLVNGREPEYTNINGEFRGTLDYIFLGGTADVTEASVEERFQLSEDSANESFPNRDWPSDHMMLKATVAFGKQAIGRPGFARTFSCPT